MTTPEIEHIYTSSWHSAPRLEVRRAPNGVHSMTIGGYGAVFGASSDPRLGFREVVERTFFNKSQGDGWPGVVALFEHQPGIVLGTVRSGTMRVTQDNYGLGYEVDLPETRSDVCESIGRGDVHSSSIGFLTYQDEVKPGPNGLSTRHLVSGRLDHVSPTSRPAYPDATVALRSFANQMDAPYDEVARDARAGELNRYLERTDNRDIAPTPALIEARNHSAAQSVTPGDLKQRLDKNRHNQFDADREGRLKLNQLLEQNRRRSELYELEERRVENRRRALVGAAETRSLAVNFYRDPNGHATQWHPAHQ